MKKTLLPLLLFALSPLAHSETRETYGIFDCVFMEQSESKSVSGSTISSSSSWTFEQKASIQRSLDTWMGLINNAAGRQLTALFSWSDNLGENVLGGSSSGYFLEANDPSLPVTIGLSPVEAVWQMGVNWNAADNFDIVIQFSSSFIPQFYFGTDSNIGFHIDFQSVMTHELGHNLGFLSFSNMLTTSTGSWPLLSNDGKTIYSQFDLLMTRNGQSITESNSFDLGSTIGVGGGDLAIYNPSLWDEGSSMSHIDPVSDPTALMNPSVSYGTVKRTPSIKELQLMEEMGWNVNWAAVGIPEPTSSALILLAGSLFLLRRENKHRSK